MYRPSDYLGRNALMFPNRLALVAQDREFTYRDLDLLASKAALVLSELGVRPKDRVAFLLGNNPAFAVLFQGLMKLGAVAVPLNKRLLGSDVAFMVDQVDARALVFDEDMATVVENASGEWHSHPLLIANSRQPLGALTSLCWKQLLHEAPAAPLPCYGGHQAETDEALIIFTSGTTSRPKAVVRSAESLSALSMVQLIAGHSLQGKAPVLYTQAPFYHMGGLLAFLKTCAMGGTLVAESHFSEERVFELVERYGVNQLYMIPPRLFTRLAESPQRGNRTYPSVSEVHCAGGRMAPKDRESITEVFPRALIRLSFGSSESGMTFTAYFTGEQLSERPERGDTVGLPNPLVSVRLTDEDGNEVPEGEPGEARIKSPMNFSYYLNLPEKTAAAFDQDGFFKTGDILQKGPEGYYRFIDRIADMVKTGGENVFAIEVERVLMDYGPVADAAVIGIPDPLYGEGIAAALVLDDELANAFSLEELIDHCRARMASFKKPRYYLLLDRIPRNNLGKVQKEQLRKRSDEFVPVSL